MRQLEQLRETWDADAVELISDFFELATESSCGSIWRGAGQGPEVEHRSSRASYTVRKGRIVSIEFFWDHAEALEAVGLSE